MESLTLEEKIKKGYDLTTDESKDMTVGELIGLFERYKEYRKDAECEAEALWKVLTDAFCLGAYDVNA